jgi:hypothetical protein
MEMPLFFGKQRVFDLQILTGGVEVAGSNPVSPTLFLLFLPLRALLQS